MNKQINKQEYFEEIWCPEKTSCLLVSSNNKVPVKTEWKSY